MTSTLTGRWILLVLSLVVVAAAVGIGYWIRSLPASDGPAPAAAHVGTDQPVPPGAPPKAAPDPSPPTRLDLDSAETFVRGVRALLLHQSTKDAAALKKAAAHFDRVCQRPAPGNAKGVDYSQVKHHMYRAYTHELLGNPEFRDRLVAGGLISADNYQFYFHAGPKDISDVVMLQLQLEDQNLVRHLRRALTRHAAASGGRYPASLGALVPKYFARIPRDPACPANGYAKRYKLDAGGRSYKLDRCDDLELGGKTTCRIAFNTKDEYKVYHMILGNFLQQERLNSFLPVLLSRSGLKPGQVVADVGSGPGLFTFPFARQVGPKGKVIALDINKSVLDYIRFVAKRRPKVNVQARLSKQDDVGLAEGSVDVAFVIQTYHAMIAFSDPDNQRAYKEKLLPWLTSIRKALRKGGRLVIQDGTDKLPTKILQRQVVKAGFKLEYIGDQRPMPGDILAVFSKP